MSLVRLEATGLRNLSPTVLEPCPGLNFFIGPNACGKTSLEAFAMGTPIVHQPGAFMRGRHTLAFYRRMGDETMIAKTADAYVQRAVRAARDRDFACQVRGEIAARSGALFDDAASIREIEDVWADAIEAR